MGEKVRILIVDDDRPTAMTISGVLEEQGYETHTAFGGREGLKKARALKPALVVLDTVMPKLSGYEVCRRLKANPDTAHIAVIMLADKGFADRGLQGAKRFVARVEAQVRGFDVGVVEFLTKPVRTKEMVKRVKSVLWSGGFPV